MTRVMLTSLVLALVCAGAACNKKSGEEAAREQLTPEDLERQKAAGTQDTSKPLPPPPKPVAIVADAAPEPTTPEQIAQARKAAMTAGRDNDVIKYCEMEGIDGQKSDPQAALGCALAACRLKQTEKAKAWSANLPKELKENAIRVCAASAITP